MSMKQYNIMFDNVHSATMHDNLNQSSNVGHTIWLANNVHKVIQYKAIKLKLWRHCARASAHELRQRAPPPHPLPRLGKGREGRRRSTIHNTILFTTNVIKQRQPTKYNLRQRRVSVCQRRYTIIQNVTLVVECIEAAFPNFHCLQDMIV